jgi:hypothetical protein
MAPLTTRVLAALVVFVLFFAHLAAASHFRYGTVTWERALKRSTTVKFKVTSGEFFL